MTVTLDFLAEQQKQIIDEMREMRSDLLDGTWILSFNTALLAGVLLKLFT